MLYLTLKYNDLTLLQLSRFNKFLASYDLEMTGQEVNSNQRTIEVAINTRLFGQVETVKKLANSFFDAALVSFRNEDDVPDSAEQH